MTQRLSGITTRRLSSSDQTDHSVQTIDGLGTDPEEAFPFIELHQVLLAIDADGTTSEHLISRTDEVEGKGDEFMTDVLLHAVILGQLTD